MMFCEHDWDALKVREPGAVNSLTFLRGLRDKLAADILEEVEICTGAGADDEDDTPKAWIDGLVRYDFWGRGYENLREVFCSRDRFEAAKQVLLLRTICRRIARLEREACHLPVLNELMEA